jgi:hypothetical protein
MYAALVEGGVDDLMAKHVAHLFIRKENFKSKNRFSVVVAKTDHKEKTSFRKG